MEQVHQRKNKCAARVNVGRIIPSEIIHNTETVIRKYQPLPMIWFPHFYWKHYNILIDASSMGYSQGILGFFRALDYMINISISSAGSYILSLKNEYMTTRKQSYTNGMLTMTPKSFEKTTSTAGNALLITRNYNRALRRLFEGDIDILWHGDLRNLLKIDDANIEIAKSPYEIVNVYEPVKVGPVINRLRQVLSAFPKGIAVSQLSQLVHFNKRLFNVTSIDAFTVEYPEIFYIHESDEDNQESLVLDGRSNTYENIKSYCPIDKENFNPGRISSLAFMTGLYQKTLLLLRKAEPEGLKLSVWNKSMRSSFGEAVIDKEVELLNLSALTVFAALYRIGWVEIRSHPGCKNDLRVHLPSRPIQFNSFL